MEMAINSHLVLLGVSAAGVAYLMALAGVEKSALEWRRRRRTCPSCGRHLQRGICRCNA
jgi:hypothetical protein